MRTFFLFLLLTMTHVVSANPVTTVYLFPGEGSDERIFSKIKFDSTYRVVHVVLPTPAEGATMKEYAAVISNQIDTNGKYIFIGVSLGGMICAELADYMKPEKIIIISSAKSCKELPFRYTFQKVFPLNKIVPKGLVKTGARILQPIVEPDRKKHADVFNSMLASKDPDYYKRTVDLILNWDRKISNDAIIHIHGTNDHTIPIRNVNADYEIKDGSHMMTLTRGDEINTLIQSILAGKK
ncbi:MAG TPA: alpha/beta hydrolase [Bacteroidia bacterium]|nr:alpha/beta hydrolase [Bacteroidia bacterium]